MKILGIDTTGTVASVALADEDAILCEISTNCKKNHSVTVMPMIDELFSRLETDISEIDYIACANGPGSFTGLRIGAATAKALAHGAGKKMIPVPTLDALAYNLYGSSKLVVPMMDARRNQVYTAFYEGGIRRITEYMAMDIEEVQRQLSGRSAVFLGDGAIASKICSAPPHLNLQRGAAVAALGMRLAEYAVDYGDFELFYLRKPQAEREYAKKIRIVPMKAEHLDRVCEIEKNTFAIPWSRKSIEEELNNKNAIYFVALEGGRVVGYCGMWHVVTEGHITNVAVDEEYRRRGIGSMLVSALEAEALNKRMIGLTLEARVGNEPAMKLYSRHGFKTEGIRKNYYADTKEDAAIMWKTFM